MSDEELGIEPGGEDSIMHKAANFAEWCKRVDGMDRGRKRAYFRSTDPVLQQPCVVVLPPPPEAAPAEATAADRQGFIDGVISELQAIDAAAADPIDAALDALVAEAPASGSDQHTAADSAGL